MIAAEAWAQPRRRILTMASPPAEPNPPAPSPAPSPGIIVEELTPAQRATIAGWAGAAAFTLIAVVFYLLRYVLIPFGVAAALAYVAMPLVRRLRDHFHLPRWVAALLVYLAYLGLFIGIGLAVRYVVVPQAIGFLQSAPHTIHRLLVTVFHGEEFKFMGQTMSAHDLTEKMVSQVGQLMRNPGHLVVMLATGVASVIGLFLTLVLLAYFLIEGPRLTAGCLWLVPPRFRVQVHALAVDVAPVIYSYVRGVLVVVLYAVLVTWLVTQFILHLPHAILLAIGVGLLEMIPVIGPVLSLALVGLVAVEQASAGMIFGFAMFAIGLRLSIDQLVGPLVLGRSVELPPPVIIFAFLAGGVLFGAIGILLAIPFAAAVKIILTDLYSGETGARGNQQRG